MKEDEMVGWHHQLNGHGSGWTPGVGDGQGGLACCGSWGHKELDTNNTNGKSKQKETVTVFLTLRAIYHYKIIQKCMKTKNL